MDSNEFSIEHKKVLVTGGTAGIGLGVAKHFVDAGSEVVVCGRRAGGNSIATSIGARFVEVDVTNTDSVRTGFASAGEMLDGLDVIILNAGVFEDSGPIRSFDLEAFERVVDVNLNGVARGLRFGVEQLERGGVILVTSSPAGSVATPGGGAYAASKAGVNILVRSAALELAREGIRVTGIVPGIVDSEMGGGAYSDEWSWMSRLTAVDGVREPSEIAAAYQFLASDAARMFHGAVVPVDDGISAGLSPSIMEGLIGT